MKEVFIKLPECNKNRMRNSSMILTTIILTLFAIGFIWQPFMIVIASVLLAIGIIVNADLRGIFHV